ncbi:MAG: tRNA pseudouridine(38-40) synthase TruA [Deltaproteobacteria bacterium]|jgi:tRNA pseudouridine38-40 synthase|nr:tRNA pseudouridine(38-40) synthase TruA [Deltaproteobacteria bacterium]
MTLSETGQVKYRNFKIKVAYRGTGLSGWQRQENGLAVQELLEDAVGKVCGHPVTIHGSGRTDAGVHAAGQIASFFTKSARTPTQMVRGANRFLPRSIAVLEAEEAPLSFHARFSCTGKKYHYDYLVTETRDPLRDWRAWWVGTRLDWDGVRSCLPELVGEKDFAAFQSAGSDVKGTVREIYGAWLTSPEPSIRRLEIAGSGFLRHMMRAIAGTLFEAGRGRLGREDFKNILASKTRPRAGMSAPPEGLSLAEAYYEPKAELRRIFGGE